ncbi:hypothetical protein SAMN05444487_11242 [Marininema mesophilum]|uniref:Uncharacterized protein n=1 Tax=Marininema mesophilum TaxID=1048340 RepID=A0A1H2ZXC6_9BACL|nr:hypothetical protein SAMN05444487_11242 [Marininema mesophilum]
MMKLCFFLFDLTYQLIFYYNHSLNVVKSRVCSFSYKKRRYSLLLLEELNSISFRLLLLIRNYFQRGTEGIPLFFYDFIALF